MAMAARAQVNLKSIALPAEHGGWGFLLEPILLALFVAPSLGGLLLGIAVVNLFLLHQPLKLAAKDRLKNRCVPRTQWAERFVLIYGGFGLSLILLLIRFNGLSFLLPMLFGGIFALVQFSYDARNQSRAIVPELAGAFALAATASSMALLAGWTLVPALMLWVLLAARALTAIIYVRARLRLAYDKPHNKMLVYSLHVAVLILFSVLTVRGLIPALSIVAIALLLLRAIKGLNFPQQGIKPKVIGFSEMGFGLAYTLILAMGYWTLLL
jgi:hypothetical protein